MELLSAYPAATAPLTANVGMLVSQKGVAFVGDVRRALSELVRRTATLAVQEALEKRTAKLRAENARLRERLTKLEAMVRAESN